MSYHDLLPSWSGWGWWWCWCFALMGTFLSVTLATLLFRPRRLLTMRSAEIASDGVPVSGSESQVSLSSSSCRSDTASLEMIQVNADHSTPSNSSRPISPSAPLVDDPQGYDYDVFLNFTGQHTRQRFTENLYARLLDAGLRVFIDVAELHVGQEIGPALLRAFKRSKISITILSQAYAARKQCLKGVALMMESMKTTDQLVLPIFYKVEPSQVRYTYEEAFRQHAKHYDEKTVQEWRRALVEVTSLKAFESDKLANGNEGELIKLVVAKVLNKLKKAYLAEQEQDDIIGVEDRIEDVKELLEVGETDVRIVGIYGIGGIGKTTLAKIIYNHLREQFEYSCFIGDVRERSSQPRGLEKLQTQLVSDILKFVQHEFANVDEGKKVLGKRFRDKKVLILLDDVDNKDQINALAADPNWFAEGSRILITTRYKDVLDVSQVRGTYTYEVKPMHFHEALHLFSTHAFRRDSPDAEYADLSRKIVATTGEIPLALKAIGSYLSTTRSREVWEATLAKLENAPKEDVQDTLRISYDVLNFTEKQIFLDIACFFIGTDRRIATHMWKECDFYPESGIEVLLAMSLINILDDNTLWMHGVHRDLGRGIVRQENYANLDARSRLWNSEEAIRILATGRGMHKIEAMRVDYGTESKGFRFMRDQFRNLSKLRFMRLDNADVDGDVGELPPNIRWLQWHYCSVQLWSTSLYLKKLVILDLSGSDITDDWNGWIPMQTAVELRVLILRFCLKLTKTPDFSRFPLLERLSLENCMRLDCVHPSIGTLKNLTYLSLKNCSRLETLPQELSSLKNLIELCIDGTCVQEIPKVESLKSLTILSARECKSLTIPPSIGQLTFLLELFLDGSGVKELPDSVGNLVKLQCLSMNRCKSLEKVPDSIGKLESLKELHLSWTSVCKLPDSVGQLKKLEVLKVIASSITCLPSSLGMSERLEVVNVSSCKDLNGKIFPDNIPSSLKALILDGTNISELSASISRLPRLQTLDLTGCCKLCTLPDLPSSLRILSVTCKQLVILPNLSSLVNLEELHLIRCEKLVEVPRDMGKFSKLKELSIDRLKISALPKEIGILSKLKELAIKDCVELKHIPELPRSLYQLEVKRFTAQIFPDLSNSEDLLELKLSYCNKIKSIPGLGRLINLRMLSVTNCNELKELDDVEKLESLRDLHISQCESLEKLPDLSMLKELRYWVTERCGSLQALPDLSGLKMLRYLNLSRCEKLYMLEGLEELVSLECLDISECKEIEDLPNLSKLQKLIDLNVECCEKLVVIEGLEEVESQVLVYIYGCTSLQIIPNLPKIKIQREKRRYPRPLNIPDISADMI